MPSIISANVPTTILALSLLREKDPVIVRHSHPGTTDVSRTDRKPCRCPLFASSSEGITPTKNRHRPQSSESSGFPPRNLKTTFSRLTHTLTIPSCDITRSFSLHYSKNVHDTLLDSFWLSYLLADLERSPSTRQLNTHRNDSVDPLKDSPFWIADSGYANWKESNLELRFVPPLAISPLDWH
jgi:hypothetical protein